MNEDEILAIIRSELLRQYEGKKRDAPYVDLNDMSTATLSGCFDLDSIATALEESFRAAEKRAGNSRPEVTSLFARARAAMGASLLPSDFEFDGKR